jgi:ribosomal protein L19
MSNKLATFLHNEYTARQTPDFKVGDVVRVHQLVPDIKAHEVGQKLSKTAKAAMKAAKKKDIEESSRIQIFEGIVIAKKHGKEAGASFTVRKIAAGNVGVEKIFPLYSPLVTKIEIVSRPKVRRAKLYFLREQVGKRARKFGTGKSVDQKVTRVSDLLVPGADENLQEGVELESVSETETVEDTPNTDSAKEEKAE